MIREENIAPTVAAINEWRARQPRRPDGSIHGGEDPIYGVNIRTERGHWRCVTSRVEHEGYTWYWTIRGEGSSNGGRETVLRADKIVAAVGWIVASREQIEEAIR